MSNKAIAIRCLYYEDDERLKERVAVPCNYADASGCLRHKVVRLTEAEKRTIEALAMRLFMEHNKVLTKTRCGDGTVELSAYLQIGKLEK